MKQISLTAFLAFFALKPLYLYAQGSLTPPGPPGPTMLTLSQIEPRTPISGPITITQPGSYYLTANISVNTSNAITIATNSVTLDLNGFTISSTTASATGYGILLNSGLENITIMNGFIRSGVMDNGLGTFSGSGFAYGVAYSGSAPESTRVWNVSVSGCLTYGIYLGTGNSTVAESCTVQTAGSYGIVASTVNNCAAWDCGTTAIASDNVSDCRGLGGNGGNGISATVAQNCQGQGGISGVNASTALNCYGYSFNGSGLSVTTAENCYGQSFNSDGIDATTALNCSGSGGNNGINVSASAQNCSGTTTGSGVGVESGYIAEGCYGASDSGYGVLASWCAQNCLGTSSTGYGIYCENAMNCSGFCGSGSSYGIYANATAVGCYGYSYSGTGIYADLGEACLGDTTAGSPYNVSHNVSTFVY